MKNRYALVISLIFIPLAFVVGKHFGEGSGTPSKRQPLYYQHPMRPDVRSTTPSKDEMGMDYIPVYEEKSSHAQSSIPGRSQVSLSAGTARAIGVQTSVATMQPLVRNVQTYGTVAFDPSLYNAIAEYREAVRGREALSESPIGEVKTQAQHLVEAARLKLKLLGIVPSQIQNEKGLLINERGRGVWVYAELYEQDISSVRAGIKAVISAQSLPGKTFHGLIRSIDPTINPVTRTARARIELQTVNENLLPDMLVDITLEVSLGTRLSIPTTAVFDTGQKQYVYIESDDHNYLPTPIKAGLKLEDVTEVLDGIKEGDRVVTHATFLIDSESRFQAGSEEHSHD